MIGNERYYQFWVDKGYNTDSGMDNEVHMIPESKLTEPQKDLLLSRAIKDYEYLPEDVKERFKAAILAARK